MRRMAERRPLTSSATVSVASASVSCGDRPTRPRPASRTHTTLANLVDIYVYVLLYITVLLPVGVIKDDRLFYKGSPYSITERGVPELIPVLDSQPAGDVSHKSGGRLPLLSTRSAVTPATLKRAATNFAAW